MQEALTCYNEAIVSVISISVVQKILELHSHYECVFAEHKQQQPVVLLESIEVLQGAWSV